MIKLFFLAIGIACLTGVYDFTITQSNGDNIQLSAFKGKKILIVNTASQSIYANQFESLEKLYQQYKDKLVIIAVPSDAFGNEPLQNEEINNQLIQKYGIHYLMTGKSSVVGDSISPLFSWLTDISKNQMMNNKISGDFYKFLINEDGLLVGEFVPSVDPLEDQVQNALTN